MNAVVKVMENGSGAGNEGEVWVLETEYEKHRWRTTTNQGIKKHKYANTGTDTDRQADRDTDRQTYRQTDRHRQADRQTDSQTDRQTDRPTDRHLPLILITAPTTPNRNCYVIPSFK